MEFYYIDSYAGYSQVDITTTKNKYSLAQWGTLEAAGAVFLPVTGSRSQSYNVTVDGLTTTAYYWTSTNLHMWGAIINGNKTWQMMSDYYYNWSSYYGAAHAVRLVQEK